MKTFLLNPVISLLGLSAVSSFGVTVIYQEDFSSSSLPSSTQANVGFFNGNATFDTIAVAANSTISGGALSVNSTSGFRGIGIILDPASFVGVGSYDLTFDLTIFDDSGNSSNFVTANVFEGSGFDQGNNADALLLNAQTGALTASGSATAALIASGTYTAAANQITLQFDYDGSSAVAIFLGVETNSFPFPSAEFDNITVSTSSLASPVPELSSFLYLSVLPGFLFLRKRSRSDSSKKGA